MEAQVLAFCVHVVFQKAKTVDIPSSSEWGFLSPMFTSTLIALFFVMCTHHTGVRWNIRVVFICISLMVSNVELYFGITFGTCISSLGVFLFISSPFLDGIVFLLYLNKWSVILGIPAAIAFSDRMLSSLCSSSFHSSLHGGVPMVKDVTKQACWCTFGLKESQK